MKSKSNGFTLVEIIVSIAVASIVLLIAGSMILNSMGFFNNVMYTDADKRSVDSIISFIRGEVSYATDVRILQNGDENEPESSLIGDTWHCFYIKDGLLYHDNVSYFSKDFYNNKALDIQVQGNYENGSRVDLHYSLNSNNKTDYSSKDSIMFMNLTVTDEIKGKGWFATDNKVSLEQANTTYKLYYSKEVKQPSGETPTKTGINGTVQDIQLNISAYNYRGVYDSSKNYIYQNGEIVWYNNHWWERVSYTDNREPGTSFGWKCLTDEYCAKSVNNICSSYEKGDIVIYQGKYYQALVDIYEHDDTQYTGFITNSNRWLCKGLINDQSNIDWAKEHIYPKKSPYSKYKTVVSKYWPTGYNLNDTLKSGFSEYDSSKVYRENDIVKVKNKSTSNFYDLYIKKARFDFRLSPGNPKSGWIKIDNVYDSGSSYLMGDEVLYINNENPWISALQDILVVQNPQTEIYTNYLYWKKIS